MEFETGDSRAAFAALSAASFPLIWTQKKLFFLILGCSSKILQTIGFGVQISCVACRADFEPVKIICLESWRGSFRLMQVLLLFV